AHRDSIRMFLLSIQPRFPSSPRKACHRRASASSEACSPSIPMRWTFPACCAAAANGLKSAQRRRAAASVAQENARLRVDDLLVGRRRHARLPGRITELEQVAARVQEVHLAPEEEAALAIDDGLGHADAPLVEQLAGPVEHLGSDLERMMEAIVL